MTKIKMHIFNVKLPFYPPCEVKCGLQNRVSTITNEEIKTALWSLKACKAPGPDGLHARFFQRFWHVVGGSVRDEVHAVFRDRKILNYLNKTNIVLIPKT